LHTTNPAILWRIQQDPSRRRGILVAMVVPKPIPFPTDRRSLLRCVRAFLDLLTLRVDGGFGDEIGCDYALPGGLSLDAVVCSLAAYNAEEDASYAKFGTVPDSEQEVAAGIAADLRELLGHAGPPQAN
jgi:hypothetical protein